jgi:hypothetical protein
VKSLLGGPRRADVEERAVPVAPREPAIGRRAEERWKSQAGQAAPAASSAVEEESLIVDSRGTMTPAQMVEQKLVSLLRGKGLLASHIQMAGLLKKRQ